MISVDIEPLEQAFLDIQVGELSDLVGDVSWHDLYEKHLLTRMLTIEKYLPSGAREYCDVGGGLSGISILIDMFYGNNLHVNVIDGDGTPIMTRHATPFSNHNVTKGFLERNGVRNVTTWLPQNLPPQKFDLITSFRSWCFHYEPSLYLEWAKTHIVSTGVLILDVRDDKAWMNDLMNAFAHRQKILNHKKGALWQFQL